MRIWTWLVLIAIALPGIAAAQSTKSPYAGEQSREIKSLSSQQVSLYMKGAGMGLAKAAELNRYPGPMHVLELDAELRLSDDQRAATEKLFHAVKDEARRLGAEIVELERELDGLFVAGEITETELTRRVTEIGKKQAELRLAHLRAHLKQRVVLTAEQTSRYVELRGY
ncbi:MAG: periplasmic heavy metal sensor [bacterium]|nr:periplasmic heavy metal sensor [bacterium]